MKFKYWYTFLLMMLFFGCQKGSKLDGNYFICQNGEYAEVYFKKDSMRFASDNDWVKLSEWRKIEIRKDTLYFETFGEWRESTKAEIKFVGKNKVEMRIIDGEESIELNLINNNLDFEKTEEFWNGFHERQDDSNCGLNFNKVE